MLSHSVFTIPKTVLGLEKNAFQGISLKGIEFEKNSRCKYIGESAFADSSIKEIKLPEGLTTIDCQGFYCCSSLESITFPKSIESIGLEAFWDCDSLKSIVFEENDHDVYIAGNAFGSIENLENIVLPKHVCYLFDEDRLETSGVFLDTTCSDTIIPEGTKRICEHLFAGAKFPNGIKFPKSLEKIERFAFCESIINEVDLSNTNTVTIEENGFYDAENLETVKLSKTLKTIESNAFKDSTSLKTVIFPEDCQIDKIGNQAFSGCTSLSEIFFPKSIKHLEGYAFESCEELAAVNFENTDLKTIPGSCFHNCHSLQELTLGSHVVAIGGDAFNNCNLTNVKIPANIKSISTSAFYDNSNLTTIDLTDFTEPRVDKVPCIGMDVFPSEVTINVANEEMKTFFESAAYWSDYHFEVAQ